MERGKLWPGSVVALLLVYLFLPIAATLLFSFAKQWQSELLPDAYTLAWYKQIFTDVRFLEAIGRSVFIGVVSVALSLLVLVPAIFVLAVYFPKWERAMQAAALLPFAFPPVVSAIGLMKLYSSGPLPITGTPWILIGVYLTIVQPYIYQSVRGSLRTIRAGELVEAAEMLGAGRWTAFRRVILPNILPGTMVAALLSFSIIFGEFVMAKMLVGGEYETVQMYLYNEMKSTGQTASAVVIAYFALILVLSGLTLKLGRWKPGRGRRQTQRRNRHELRSDRERAEGLSAAAGAEPGPY
ncbi:ABC transporter permease [Paenibacillus methanolicus]|uniref:Putative spermidine/putrescine transport system permease protein n=1 Tax=Paenibacillus methanolicus TaxID=582686 RepID=A0A5S5BUZ2_9BACL|nr:ABC transporter permease [Paenibacillus methanolicus]TYP69403.1 putative spermidine/putrescine transport system permease protein [Paenibacillus methanolicus]